MVELMRFEVIKNVCPSSEEVMKLNKSLYKKNIVIYGAGQGGSGAKKYFEKMGIKVLCFSDSDSKRHNKNFCSIKCIDREEIKNIENVCVFVCVRMYFNVVSEFLRKEGLEHYNFDTFIIPNTINELENVYNLLNDDISKKVFVTVLLARYNCDVELIKNVYTDNHYFELESFSKINENEVFVDCGAFVGDTLDRFLTKSLEFSKYYAFEAFEINYNELEKHTFEIIQKYPNLTDKIVIENKAVGDSDSIVSLTVDFDDVAISASFSSDGETGREIESIKLDTYFKDIYPPTFIKADIESNEMNMLIGCENIIQEYKPKMAISIYHKYEDIYDIIAHIHKIEKKYKFAVRHHTYETFYDTVLYAWTEN